ncbi:MAG: molybdopterin-guanine dinucleotide biosynthesis protein B [Planctomycetia bacterium]|nr:molybdopterin-guanine dinucleotide biosynthesis protein B [Planctomycetia bacterium]
MLDGLPILGVCGWSGSGKTTLIERIVPRLSARGLEVVVVKHDAHGIDVDRAGKDSDRLFKAGADVMLQGPEEELVRIHKADVGTLTSALSRLAQEYDVVLVEGHKGTPLTKVWLLGDGEESPPSEAGGVIAVLRRDCDRADALSGIIEKWLPEQWLKTPVFGCVLIGGKSARMGTPKHLLKQGGKTWLQCAVELLQQVTEQVAIVGAGQVGDGVPQHVRLPDAPDAEGPMAGILAAMRWAPQSSWLVAACDLPTLSPEGGEWVLATRAPGVWATLPSLGNDEYVEPLFAHYDFRSRLLLEACAAEGDFSMASIAKCSKVIVPSPPANLSEAWQNINTRAQLHANNRPRSQE